MKCIDLGNTSLHGSARSFACGLQDTGRGGKRWECANFSKWKELYDAGRLPGQKWTSERKWMGGLLGNAERDKLAAAKSASNFLNSFESTTDDPTAGSWWQGVFYSGYGDSGEAATLSKRAQKKLRKAKAEAAQAEKPEPAKAGLQSKSARKKAKEIAFALSYLQTCKKAEEASKSNRSSSAKSRGRSDSNGSSDISSSDSSEVEDDSDDDGDSKRASKSKASKPPKRARSDSRDGWIKPSQYTMPKTKKKKGT